MIPADDEPDFPELDRAAYGVADFATEPPFLVIECSGLRHMARQVESLRAGRPLQLQEGFLSTSAPGGRRRTLTARVLFPDGSIARDLRLLFQGEAFDVVRTALADARAGAPA